MHSKKWIIIVFLVLFINMFFVALINYIVDPFAVFKSKVFTHQLQMNERFVKVDYLQENHQNYNAYLFGSSRIGVIEPKVFEKYIPQSKFYNFTLSSANLYDYLNHLEYFVKEGYEIKTLVVQLDLNDMNYYEKAVDDYLSLSHPSVLDESSTFFYARYLFGFFPVNLQSTLETNFSQKILKTYDLKSGVWSLPLREKDLLSDAKKYVKNQKCFYIKNRRVIQYTKEIQNKKALQEIVNLCKKEKIKLYFFSTPHNKNMMDTFVLEDYHRYLNDIAHITSFYDFSGYNSVTNNNTNYYETSHYRPQVGKLIAAKIFNDSEVFVPNDFGIYRKKGVVID